MSVPYIQSFDKQSYQGGTQNWDFAQDEHGNLFIANNEGLLSFNGSYWKKYPLPNYTIARSLAYDSDQKRLYIGGQDAFGYFAPDERGQLQYTDCKPYFPLAQRAFADVWHIVLGEEKQVFFQSIGQVYELRDTVGKVHEFEEPVIFLGEMNGRVVTQEQSSGLHTYENGTFNLLPSSYPLKDQSIVALCAGLRPNESWIVTLDGGIFHQQDNQLSPYPILRQDWLLQQRMLDATITPKGNLVLASSNEGALLIDLPQARIHQRINKNKGLQNNHIRSLFIDRQHDLWLGLDNGLDFVDLNSPFSRFVADNQLESTTYSIKIFDQQLYLGNSNGLYVAPWQNYYDPLAEAPIFSLVPGSDGQVWNLDEVNGELWLAHDDGAFRVTGKKLSPVADDLGYWKFLPITDHQGEEQLIAGNYQGLRQLNRSEGSSVFQPVSDLAQSARILAKDQQHRLWVSHPYRGIYQVDFRLPTDQLESRFYGQANGLPSDLENYVFSIFNELIVCAKQGIYRYEDALDSFVLHPTYADYFSVNEQIRRLVPDAAGNLWYISSTEAGRLTITQRGLEQDIEQQRYPEIRDQLVGGFEYVYPYDEQYVFFGAEKGVIHFDPSWKRTTTETPPAQLSQIFLLNEQQDKIFQWSSQFQPQGAKIARFKANERNFRFEFTSPAFGKLAHVEYQHFLAGLEKDYGHWTNKTDKEYTNLPPGTYTFHCRSRLNQGEPSEAVSYSFVIAPPWYLSSVAFVLYGLLALTGIWSMIQIPRRKFAREKEAMVQEQAKQAIAFEQEVQASEETIDLLKNEKYRSELAFQSTQLASLTMHIVQKNELINRLGDEVEKISKKLNDQGDQQRLLRPLKQLLTEDEVIENDWEQFVYHFDQVHSGFFQRLRQKYSQLTPKDHKLCAYLRMNLSTKDIAPLLNISVRGVEISRYRLRKKLDLPKEENLVEYMMNF